MLDSHDCFLISRATGAGMNSTTEMHKRFPRAFRSQLGIWESAEHLVTESNLPKGHSAALVLSSHKLAPVLFLSTKKVKQISTRSGGSRVEERCWFSTPADKMQVQLDEDSIPAAESSSNSTVARPPRNVSSRTTAGLRCTLGPAHQPTACALYPLGELYSTPVGTSSSASSRYYSLDVSHCEGTRAISTVDGSSARGTVAQYEERNGLAQRRLEWEHFEREVARPIAARGWLAFEPDPALAHALTADFQQRLAASLACVWFDFDSLQCAPPPQLRFPDWASARSAITAATREISDATDEYVRECSQGSNTLRLAAEERWTVRLRQRGCLKRDDQNADSVRCLSTA
jgi:hypothetical protein